MNINMVALINRIVGYIDGLTFEMDDHDKIMQEVWGIVEEARTGVRKANRYTVSRRNVKGNVEDIKTFSDLEAAKCFREYLYMEDERCRQNGEKVEYVTYIIRPIDD